MSEFFYSVEGPGLYGDSEETARWGISARVSESFANLLVKHTRTERIEEILEGDAKLILRRGRCPNFSSFKRRANYSFFEDTCLLRAVHVPGNACDLALDESALHRLSDVREGKPFGHDIGYMQHNVDSFLQAVFLEVLFR